LNCYVREDGAKENKDLLIEFNFCNYLNRKEKCEKSIVKGSLSIQASIPSTRQLDLIDDYASTFTFSSNDFDSILAVNDRLYLSVEYSVDSSGIIEKKKFQHVLNKDSECDFKFVMH
jgi:hypothetical protein